MLQHYSKLTTWAWMGIRHTLLSHLQPNKTRITIFLKLEIQKNNGSFHLELHRQLPKDVKAPQLVSRRKIPYDFLQFENGESLVLGSNMFNDVKRPMQAKAGGLSALQQILTTPCRPKHNDDRDKKESEPICTKAAAVQPINPSPYDSVQLQLPAVTTPDGEAPDVIMESLLELYDSAVPPNE